MFCVRLEFLFCPFLTLLPLHPLPDHTHPTLRPRCCRSSMRITGYVLLPPPKKKFSPLPVPFPDRVSGSGSLLGGRATWKRECLVLGSFDSGDWSSRCVPQLSLEEALHSPRVPES